MVEKIDSLKNEQAKAEWVDGIIKETVDFLRKNVPANYGIIVLAFGPNPMGVKVHAGASGAPREQMGQFLQQVGRRWESGLDT